MPATLSLLTQIWRRLLRTRHERLIFSLHKPSALRFRCLVPFVLVCGFPSPLEIHHRASTESFGEPAGQPDDGDVIGRQLGRKSESEALPVPE
jgi:hypothetical protein